MSRRRVTLLATALLFVSLFASAASQGNIRIKVVDSETHSQTVDGSDVPKNCDGANYDAYCNGSKSVQMTNTLLVEEDNGSQYRIVCSVDTRWSRCVPLPIGESFDAKREKRGLTVYYIDDKGKARSQFYNLVAGGGKANAPATTAAATPSALAPHAAAAAQNSPSPAPAPPPAVAKSGRLQNASPGNAEKVKCSFNSTPAGADITVDGSYVGNTPSEISLSTGTHRVQIAMPGFVAWKRELTITADSEVNVTASLQKEQP